MVTLEQQASIAKREALEAQKVAMQSFIDANFPNQFTVSVIKDKLIIVKVDTDILID